MVTQNTPYSERIQTHTTTEYLMDDRHDRFRQKTNPPTLVPHAPTIPCRDRGNSFAKPKSANSTLSDCHWTPQFGAGQVGAGQVGTGQEGGGRRGGGQWADDQKSSTVERTRNHNDMSTLVFLLFHFVFLVSLSLFFAL